VRGDEWGGAELSPIVARDELYFRLADNTSKCGFAQSVTGQIALCYSYVVSCRITIVRVAYAKLRCAKYKNLGN